jgi:predicted Rossmann fold flavoprotein
MRAIVIGGGAAGFFGAISCALNNPEVEVVILEKSHKLLSKVKISGGGRCNITNACFENYELIKNYPRGANELKKLFSRFSVQDTIDFFEKRGVKLKIENDGRMFPVSDNSQSVIDCLVREARVHGVRIMTEFAVKTIEKAKDNSFQITLRSGEFMVCDRILIATGGNPNDESYQWLREIGHDVIPPVPSLFTFNVPNSRFNGLQGVSVKNVSVRIAGKDFEQRGPILITHWGFSGPAILKLSAWAARKLAEVNYNFNIHINWTPEYSEVSLREFLLQFREENHKKNIHSHPLFDIPKRLWERMCLLSGALEELKWADFPNRNLNRLIEELVRGNFYVSGKTTFKEEFTTCGGVNLKNIDLKTMQSKHCPGIYFAGEVLDIDGVTGGFNFQAAWTTGWIAGKAMGETTREE